MANVNDTAGLRWAPLTPPETRMPKSTASPQQRWISTLLPADAIEGCAYVHLSKGMERRARTGLDLYLRPAANLWHMGHTFS